MPSTVAPLVTDGHVKVVYNGKVKEDGSSVSDKRKWGMKFVGRHRVHDQVLF